jgi:hypothetical protein
VHRVSDESRTPSIDDSVAGVEDNLAGDNLAGPTRGVNVGRFCDRGQKRFAVARRLCAIGIPETSKSRRPTTSPVTRSGQGQYSEGSIEAHAWGAFSWWP